MKQKNEKNILQRGFTIVELMTVVTIIIVLSTIVVIDFNGQRTQRSISIAMNETVTNIRKVQGYILSSRNISEGRPAKFYVVRMVAGQSYYRIQAIDNDFGYVNSVEDINLPSGMTLQNFSVATSNPGINVTYDCLQIVFSAPYGKMYAKGSNDSNCRLTSLLSDLQDPIKLSQLNEREATIKFSNTSGPISRTIVLTPISGLVTPN